MRELLGRMDSRELSEWSAYYGLNPWGPERADLRAGTVAAIVANCHTTDTTYRPSDFMPQFGPQEPVSDEDLRLAAIRANALLGGDVR